MKHFLPLLIFTALVSCDDRAQQGDGVTGGQAETPDAAQAIVSPGYAAVSPYPYVWVTAQGGVHELDEWDRRYLETPFTTTDPIRPYTKTSLESKDKWGGAAGFFSRERLTIETSINADPVKRISNPTSRISAEYEEYVADREVLSEHETIAEFQGLTYHVCHADVVGCPEFCSDSGEFTNFRIVKYLEHQAAGESNHSRMEEFRLRVSDFHRKPINSELEPLIRSLGKGDRILLSWCNEEVTLVEDFLDRSLQKMGRKPLPAELAAKVSSPVLKNRVVERLQRMERN